MAVLHLRVASSTGGAAEDCDDDIVDDGRQTCGTPTNEEDAPPLSTPGENTPTSELRKRGAAKSTLARE